MNFGGGGVVDRTCIEEKMACGVRYLLDIQLSITRIPWLHVGSAPWFWRHAPLSGLRPLLPASSILRVISSSSNTEN